MTAEDTMIDVHQHLWPQALIEALRRRTRPPRLRDWTLELDGEPPYEVVAGDHDPATRLRVMQPSTPPTGHTPTMLALVSLSSPLGLEDLARDEAASLLDGWHTGAGALPTGFGAWAAVTRDEPDTDGLARLLKEGFAGLQVPATWLATPWLLERVAPVLAVCEQADRPVLVHPGAVAASGASPDARGEPERPGWWPAVVDYPAQLQAAWWAWQVAGRSLLPALRIGFVAGAGLAPLHHERLRARGGRSGPIDPGVFIETSSYGPQAVAALIRVLGIGSVVRGSDRPYAEPAPFGLEAAAERAIDVINPHRFLFGGRA